MNIHATSSVTNRNKAVVVDYPRYGNYEIVSCGHTTGLISYDLQQSSVYLQKAINSIGANSHSYSNANAYKALFNGVNPVEVKQLFQQIADGANFSIPGTKASARPRIICATTDAQHIWDICQQSEVPAAWAYNTPYIFLCPAFWQNLPLAPKSESCGSLTQDGKFLTGNGLMRSQYTILVQELARMYFTNLGKHFLQPEVNGQNGAMALPATKSVINPTSYALYAGSKLSSPFSFFQCLADRRT